MLHRVNTNSHFLLRLDLRLAFEIFHYIEKTVIDVRLVMELNLDLVKIREGILFSKSAISHCLL